MKGEANMSENYNDKNIKKILESENVPQELKPESIKIMLDKFSGERKNKINFKRTAMRVIPIAAAFAVTVSAAFGYMLKYNHDGDKCLVSESSLNDADSVDSMKYAADYSEVYNYFKLAEKKASRIKSNGYYGYDIVEDEVMADGAIAEDSVQEEEVNQNSVNVSSQQKKDYSDTYNQETGVLEADIAKTDGNNIYYACGNVINAANVKDGKFLNTIQFHKDEEAINDMYLYNNILIVISSANNFSEDVNYGEENDCCGLIYNDTCISFYTSGEYPQLIGTYTQEGSYNDVRLTDNGYLYLVSNTEKYYSSKDFTSEEFEKYMEKEIHEQPEVTKKMMNEYIDDDSKDVIKGMPDLSKYKNVTIVACGSAMHAGLIGKHLIEEYGNIPVNVEIASEFRYKKLFIDKDTLVIAISQSGETADTLEAVKIANEKGCDTLGIVNVNGSSIARETSKVLYTKAGPEIAVATTKAYSAQVTLLSFLAYSLAKKSKDKDVLNEVSTFLSDLNRLPILMQEILNNKDEYKSLADKIYDKDNIFFIGRGIDEALCMEGSLKLKEISYIHSEAYAAGELKHGTISLIEDGTPVFGIVTDKKIADKTISNLKEVKSRGANVIYVTTNSLNKDGDFYDEKVIIPDTNPLLQPLLTILPLQLTAYYVAKNKNCDIDKPKNLAKSVTVE